MSYSTYTSILTIVPGLPQDASEDGFVDCIGVISKHISRADAIINAKIGKRYDVPLSSTPSIIATLSEDITAYYVYRSFYTSDNYNKTDYFEELRKDAFDVLNEIKNGDMDIPGLAESSTTTSTIVDSNIIDYQPFFDIDDDLDWKFDADLMDSINDKR